MSDSRMADLTTQHSPYPAYTPSGAPWLGDVPEHWEVRPLRNVLTGTAERNRPHLPLLSVVRERGVILRDITNMEENHNFVPDDLSNYKVVHSGQFAMNKMKAWQGSYGISQHDGIVSPAYFVFDLNGVSGDYFHAAIRSRAYVSFFAQASDGVRIGQWDLSQARMREIPFAFPPLPEQAAIVRYLDHADRRIRRYVSAKRKLIALLEEEKQAVVNRAVTRGLDPNVCLKPAGVEWPGDVPRHWERRRLKTVLRPVDRRSTSGSETLLSLRREHGVVVYADHFKRPPQSRSLVGFKLVSAGQLVVNRLQANNGLIFNSAVDGLVSPDYSVFEGRSPIDMKFLSDLLRTSSYRAYFRQNATGLGTGTAGFLRLYDDTLLETPVYLPHVGEQSAIVEHLDIAIEDKDAAIARARRQIELVQEYRTRLIADVVTGKLDVREAAAQLPDEDDEAEPIAESVLQIYGLDEDLCDADNLEEESVIEREVSA